MAKVTKNIPMPPSDREPKAGKAGLALATAAAKNDGDRIKSKETSQILPKKAIEPDPLLIYMGRAVLKKRTEMGLTQLQLSQKAGCASTAIFMVEGAKHNMTIKSVMLLAAALDLQVSDFFPRSTPRR